MLVLTSLLFLADSPTNPLLDFQIRYEAENVLPSDALSIFSVETIGFVGKLILICLQSELIYIIGRLITGIVRWNVCPTRFPHYRGHLGHSPEEDHGDQEDLGDCRGDDWVLRGGSQSDGCFHFPEDLARIPTLDQMVDGIQEEDH